MKKTDRPMTEAEQKDLAEIYNKHYSNVYNHVLSVVKNQHDAEDVTIDVFDKIRKLNAKESTRFNSELSAFSTWIRTVTYSVVLDFFRTNHQEYYKAVSDFADGNDEEKTYFNFVAPEQSRADNEVLTKELHSRIAKAFRTLKPKYRKIAILYFLRDLPYVEIANIVNVPMGTVKGMLSRARQKLQDELKGVHTLRAVKPEMSEA